MRPVCSSCGFEMQPVGGIQNIGYLHQNAPVEFSRAKKFTCPDCTASVYLPIGYCNTGADHEPADYVEVRVQQTPGGKLP